MRRVHIGECTAAFATDIRERAVREAWPLTGALAQLRSCAPVDAPDWALIAAPDRAAEEAAQTDWLCRARPIFAVVDLEPQP